MIKFSSLMPGYHLMEPSTHNQDKAFTRSEVFSISRTSEVVDEVLSRGRVRQVLDAADEAFAFRHLFPRIEASSRVQVWPKTTYRLDDNFLKTGFLKDINFYSQLHNSSSSMDRGIRLKPSTRQAKDKF